MRIAIFIFFLSMTLELFSQDELGVKLDFGASVISNSFVDKLDNWSVNKAPSGNIGIVYNHHFLSNSILGLELVYMHVESRELINDIVYTDSKGNALAYGTGKMRKRISYFTMPVYYGYKFSKWSVNAGFQFSMVISSSAEVKVQSDYYDYSYSEDMPLNKMDYGPRIGLNWQMSDKFSLEGMYYRGMKNIFRNSGHGEDANIWKVEQFVLGIQYTFYRKSYSSDPILP